jgi:predicted amidohydrolase YtcJ
LPILEFTLFADVPRFTHADRVRGIRVGMRRYHSAGVTGTYEGHGVSPDIEAAYAELHAAGQLSMRCRLVLSPDWSTVDEAVDALRGRYARAAGRGTGDEWLRTAGVFVGIGARGCVAETLHRGLPYTAWAGFAEWEHPLDEWEPISRAAAEAGLRIHTLINDEAVLTAALDVLERIDASVAVRGQRVVLEHLRWSTRPLLERIRALGALVTTQPAGYLWKAGSAVLEGERSPEEYVSHALLAGLGIPFALSTDDKPFDSRWSLWAAVARTERHADRVVGSGQRLDVRRALQAMTIDAARLSFDEDERGSISPGKLADLVVFDEDPEAVPPERLRDLPVVATLVGGRVVHAAGSLAGLDAVELPA